MKFIIINPEELGRKKLIDLANGSRIFSPADCGGGCGSGSSNAADFEYDQTDCGTGSCGSGSDCGSSELPSFLNKAFKIANCGTK